MYKLDPETRKEALEFLLHSTFLLSTEAETADEFGLASQRDFPSQDEVSSRLAHIASSSVNFLRLLP